MALEAEFPMTPSGMTPLCKEFIILEYFYQKIQGFKRG